MSRLRVSCGPHYFSLKLTLDELSKAHFDLQKFILFGQVQSEF